MNRRRFLSVCSVALARLQQLRNAGDPPPYGANRLGIEDERDGTLYVPRSYKDSVAMPLLLMLHGLGGSAESVGYTFPLAEEFGIIILAPESRGITWGISIPGFDDDSQYIAAAFRYVQDIVHVDNGRVALGGHSDGAGYALGMGLAYGDVLNHLMIFSGGVMRPYRRKGKPRIFFGHGIDDRQMPIALTARKFVPELRKEGYDVTLKEYQGGHATPVPVVREAFEWFLADKKPG